MLREPSVRVVAYQECWTSWEVVLGCQNGPAPTKMLIKIESAQAFCVSIFGGVGTFAISRLSVSTLKPLLE